MSLFASSSILLVSLSVIVLMTLLRILRLFELWFLFPFTFVKR